MRGSVRARLALTSGCAALAAMLPVVARAQLVSTVPGVQTRITADPNGVDLVTGAFTLRHLDLSFGPNGGTRLAIETQVGSGDGENFSGYVYERTESSINYLYAVRGSQTFKFRVNGSVYSTVMGDGSTLTHPTADTYLLTGSDGRKTEFYHHHYSSGGLYQGSGYIDYMNYIEYPDGERLTVSTATDSANWCESAGGDLLRSSPSQTDNGAVPYVRSMSMRDDGSSVRSAEPARAGAQPQRPPNQNCYTHPYRRIQSITSNLGYQMRFAYQANSITNTPGVGGSDNPGGYVTATSVTAVNLTVDYCDPTASTCTYTRNWPKLTYSFHGTNGQYLTNAYTDSMGRAWSVQPTYNSADGSYDIAVRRPSSTTPYITAHLVGEKTRAVATPAGTWTYAWTDNAPAAGKRTVAVTDPLGNKRTVVSTLASGLIDSDKDTLGNVKSYSYDVSGLVITATLPDASSETYTYDSRGNVTQRVQVARPNSGTANITTTSTYPATCTATGITSINCNSPLTSTDGRGNVTSFTWDPTHGGLTSVTSPAVGGIAPKTLINYGAFQAYGRASNQLLTPTTPLVYRPSQVSACRIQASCANGADEVRTTFMYNNWGNLKLTGTTKSAGDGSLAATTTVAYDDFGNAISVDGPLPGTGDTTYLRYNADYEPVGVILPDPDGAGPLNRRATRVTYSAGGLVTKTEAGTVAGTNDADWANFVSLQQVNASYDAQDRKDRETLTGGGATYGVTDYGFDAKGRLSCTAVRMNPSAWSTWTQGCSLQTAGSQGPDRITRTEYDEFDRVKAVTGGYGTGVAALEARATYRWDGQVETATDANGNVTGYAYDGLNRLSEVHYPVPVAPGTTSTTDWAALVYDASGNVTQRRVRDGQVINYAYDALNRLTAIDRPNTVYGETDRNYGYDSLGNLTRASDSNGRVLTFGYDALGRRVSQADNWYAMGGATFGYDLAGRRTRLTWGDGVYVTYDRDATGGMTVIRESGSAAAVTFRYDDLGRRSSLTWANGTGTGYYYDGMSRLTQLVQDLTGTASDVTSWYGYNPAGQLTSRTSSNDAYAWRGAVNVNRSYGVNGLNQYTASGSTPLGYDGRGNLTSSGSASYAYTADNELATAPGVLMWSDPLGRLFNVNAEGGVNTTLLYDGADVIAEVNQASGVTLRRYVQGPGTDEPMIWYEGSGLGDRRFLYADERGSVIAVGDGAGNAVARNTYDEYGIPGPGNIGRFQYTGQKWLPSVGLYDYKARDYSPTLGRFLQSDPIGYGDGMNMYGYVGNDPVNKIDPSGLARQVCTTVGGGSLIVDGALVVQLGQRVCRYEFDSSDYAFFYHDFFDRAPRAPAHPTQGGGGKIRSKRRIIARIQGMRVMSLMGSASYLELLPTLQESCLEPIRRSNLAQTVFA